MTRRLLSLLVACGVAVSACGGHGHPAASAGSGHRRPVASAGSALFVQACGACHTLTGHNDPRHQGGDLRHFHASRTQLRQLAAEMPVRHPLSRAQLATVVRFVMGIESGRP